MPESPRFWKAEPYQLREVMWRGPVLFSVVFGGCRDVSAKAASSSLAR